MRKSSIGLGMMVRNVLSVDRRTHRFLIEPLSGHLHLKTMLMSRLVTFYRGLVNSPKFTVRFLARLAAKDHRTVLGKTLHYLLDQCDLQEVDDLSPSIVKKKLLYNSASQNLNWQVSMATELLKARNKEVFIDGFNDEEINLIFDYICTE